MDCVRTNLKYRNPIEDFPFYVLVELSGSNSDHDQEVGIFLSHKHVYFVFCIIFASKNEISLYLMW